MPQTYTTQTYTTQITATSIAAILKKLPAKKPPLSAALQNSATNCNHCTGFDNCQYPGHRGYRPVITEHGTALTACRYLAAWKTQRRQDNLQATSGIPIAYQHLDFRDFKYHSGTYQALLAAMELSSLYLTGDSHTGKTLLLSLIGNAHIKAGRQVQYATTAEMLLQLRYTNDACEERLRYYQNIPILLLDDLGQERPSDYGEEQLHMVLDGRYRQQKTTVISSHYSLTALSGRYSQALVERVRQASEREERLIKWSNDRNP